jgi:hypothetical protein
MDNMGEAPPGSDVLSKPSNLERVFGFTHEAFRQYMHLQRSRQQQAATFETLSSQMAAHDHPLVMYAAGWALAEAALRRRQGNAEGSSLPFSARAQYLKGARPLWGQAVEGFIQARRTAPSMERQADFWGYEMRARRARAYISSMRIAAAWLSEYDLPSQHLDQELQRTHKGALELGARICYHKTGAKEFTDQRKGIVNEMLSGLLIQAARQNDPLHYLIVPASLRQDNKRKSEQRVDLLAISAGLRHPQLMIQVTTATSDRRPGYWAHTINAYQDLALWGSHHDPFATLHAFIQRENGRAQNPAVSSRLDELSGSIFEGLLAYEAKITRRPAGNSG